MSTCWISRCFILTSHHPSRRSTLPFYQSRTRELRLFNMLIGFFRQMVMLLSESVKSFVSASAPSPLVRDDIITPAFIVYSRIIHPLSCKVVIIAVDWKRRSRRKVTATWRGFILVIASSIITSDTTNMTCPFLTPVTIAQLRTSLKLASERWFKASTWECIGLASGRDWD